MSTHEVFVPKNHIDVLFAAYRDRLSQQLRYERFMENETSAEWERLLGPDVIALTHPRVTAEITESFIAYQESRGTHLTAEEQSLLRTTPWIHDLGEIVLPEFGICDISFDQKNSAHEREEFLVFTKVIELLPQSAEKDLIRNAFIEVAFHKASKLGRMFNAIERIGYLETAIRAFQGVNGERVANWRGLVGNVLSNQIEKLLLYEREYPYVAAIIDDHIGDISVMFAAVSAHPVPPDHEGNPSYDRKKFADARTLWETFLR